LIDYAELISKYTINGNGFRKMSEDDLAKVDYIQLRRTLVRWKPRAMHTEIDYMVDCLYGERLIHEHSY